MHEPFYPTCGHCNQFVYCYSPESPLFDWGYCQRGEVPSQEELSTWETEARVGNYAWIYGQDGGLFQESDDGCQHYEPRLRTITHDSV